MTAERTTVASETHPGLRFRALEPEGWDVFYQALIRAFGGVPESDEETALWNGLTEYDRSTAVFDGEDLVGTCSAFSFLMTVPGGKAVPAAGVTMVSVRPTHRRRGVLRSMMRRQSEEVRERGEPLAVLTASEPAIYGRFGYGLATEQARVEIDTGRVRFSVPEGTDRVLLRLEDPAAVRDRCEEVYARRVPLRAGMLARRPGWEGLPLLDPAPDRAGAGRLQCVTASLDGVFTGYARYAVKPDWAEGGPSGTVVVRDVEALDPASYAALWRFLFGIDLTSSLVARNRPADDPLLHLVSDIRRCRIGVRDGLFVRPVDVGAALSARTYRVPVDVVLDVADPFCPWNEGRWRLSGDAGGASCERTRDPAELALSARELGSAYLGGFGLAAMAGAGRVRELREGALARAAVAFRGDLAPWLPHGF